MMEKVPLTGANIELPDLGADRPLITRGVIKMTE